MRLAWLTDLHFDFTSLPQRQELYARVDREGARAALITGDIGTADTLPRFLKELDGALQRPVYFVLGNHDFYGGSMAQVRDRTAAAVAASRWLRWLTMEREPIPLSAETALVGHDGWADGRFGDFFESRVVLNDYLLIRDLKIRSKPALFKALNALGDEAARALESRAAVALRLRSHVLVATHVPPFREAAWHEGNISSDQYLPHFASRAAGERLATLMRSHSDRKMTVVCGHTHSGGTVQIASNLLVHTGGSEYGRPRIQAVLEV
jgi:3',5'-cyclic AMP phosphodiesterase CpdA